MIVWYSVVSLHLCKEYLTAVKLKALTQRIFKYGDVQNINLTSDKELYIFDILNAYLRHHIQELYTIKNGPVLLAHPV